MCLRTLKPYSNLSVKGRNRHLTRPPARELLSMRNCTSVQNFFPSHTAGKWSPKRAARLPFCTSCASHWSQTVPLLVDGKLRKGSWEHFLTCPTAACIHLADSVRKRKLDCHWRHCKNASSAPTPRGAIYFTNDNPRKCSQAATPGLPRAR